MQRLIVHETTEEEIVHPYARHTIVPERPAAPAVSQTPEGGCAGEAAPAGRGQAPQVLASATGWRCSLADTHRGSGRRDMAGGCRIRGQSGEATRANYLAHFLRKRSHHRCLRLGEGLALCLGQSPADLRQGGTRRNHLPAAGGRARRGQGGRRYLAGWRVPSRHHDPRSGRHGSRSHRAL
jgi:hypothetical protein